MAQERRNYYRVLHVQPEAPPEIIAAAYRCLMTKLRHHPDLGGDHDTAVLINQAYAVLSDPARRRAYDGQRRRPPNGTGRSEADPARRPGKAPAQACPFCELPIPRRILPDTRCQRCRSPLAPTAYTLRSGRELFGRRSAPRIRKDWPVLIQTSPSARPAAARLRDLSVTGVSLHSDAAVRAGRNIRIEAPGMELVARVVEVRPHARTQLIGAQLLTALFASKSGAFMSTRA